MAGQPGEGWPEYEKKYYDYDDKSKTFTLAGKGQVRDDEMDRVINCLGYATGEMIAVYPGDNASMSDLLNNLGYRCGDPKKLKCGPCDKEIMVYLVRKDRGKDKFGDDKESAKKDKEAKEKAGWESKGAFPASSTHDPAKGVKGMSDFHAVKKMPNGTWSSVGSYVKLKHMHGREWSDNLRDPDAVFTGEAWYEKKRCCKKK